MMLACLPEGWENGYLFSGNSAQTDRQVIRDGFKVEGSHGGSPPLKYKRLWNYCNVLGRRHNSALCGAARTCCSSKWTPKRSELGWPKPSPPIATGQYAPPLGDGGSALPAYPHQTGAGLGADPVIFRKAQNRIQDPISWAPDSID